MTVEDYHRALWRVSYKPGWHFALRPCAGVMVELEIQCPVLDSWPPHAPTNIAMSFWFALGEWSNVNRFYAFLFDCIERVERHERAEWFRVDGVSWPSRDHSTF